MTKRGLLTRSGLIFMIIVILIIVANIIFIAYTYLNDSKNLNYVVLNDSDNDVEITNILPITDESGRKIDSSKNGMVVYKKITVTNKANRSSGYRILLNVNTSTTTIDPKYIKVLVSDKNDKVLPYYDYVEAFTLNKLDNKNGSYILHSSRLKKGKSDTFIIRFWISTFYYINDNSDKFYGNISIYSY